MTWEAILDELKPIEFPKGEVQAAPERSVDQSLRQITQLVEKIGRIHFRSTQTSELTTNRIEEIAGFLEQHVESLEDAIREERRKIGELQSGMESAIAALMELTDLGFSAAVAARRELGQEASSQFEKLYSEMLRACSRIGLEATAIVGQKFDPTFMESVDEVIGQQERQGEILEVVRQGYRYSGKVQRFAKVVVAR